jgi:hypothetical protein
VGGSVDGGVHSALELDDGVEDVGEEGWSQAATGSSSHITPTLRASSSTTVSSSRYASPTTVSSSRYASPLSSIHVDLHRVGCRQQLRGGWVRLCTAVSAENGFSAAFGMVRRNCVLVVSIRVGMTQIGL